MVICGFALNVLTNNFYIFDQAYVILRNAAPLNTLSSIKTSSCYKCYRITVIPYLLFAYKSDKMHPNKNARVKLFVYINH